MGDPTSGQSRFAETLGRGLRAEGAEVEIASVWSLPAFNDSCKASGLGHSSLHEGRPSTRRHSWDALLSPREAPALADLLGRRTDLDWIVVLSDELVTLGRAVPTSGPRTAYICNGDFATLLFNRSFYATGGTSKSVASLWTSRAIMDHARAVETYDLLLANSRFTQNFMSHLYGVPFSGICHPPVDLVRFQPSASPPTNSYALALGRGPREQGIDVLTEVARIGRLKVVGGAEIRGAESAGVVSDDRLAQLYAEAAFVVFPVVSEFFGYAVAESLACGTPVLCYGLCGPGELVTNGVDGWTVNSRSEFLRVAAEVMARGYPASYRAAARGAASRFSATEVARSLIKSLRQASGETPREA